MRDVLCVPYLFVSEEILLENIRSKQQDSNVVSFIPNGDYYFHKALQELDKEQLEKAYKYIKRAAELSPDNAQILMQYGVVQMDRGQFEHAYELIHTAYSLEPSNPDMIFMLAEVSGYIGFLQDAKKYALQYLEIEPNGMYRLEAEDILEFAEEEQDLLVDIQDEDKDKIISLEKSQRLMEQKQFDQAIDLLEQTIERYPTEWPAYNNLSLAYFYVGEVEQAKALLNHVMRETNATNLHALCNLAVIAYSQMDTEALNEYIDVLNKIQPYNFENRHKLGVTLALIGENETAFKWLHSLSRKGYVGDSGFYFWLSNSAYFSGHEELAKSSWAKLIEQDPTKEGFEPWNQQVNMSIHYSPAKDLDFIVNKLKSEMQDEKLMALFTLSISPHKQEIIAHPKWIDVDRFDVVEKLMLAYVLGYPLNEKNELEKCIVTAMQAAQLVLDKNDNFNIVTRGTVEQIFSLLSLSVVSNQKFKNAKGLAAAADYIFLNVIDQNVTKKEIAHKYEISVSTLTKYCNVAFEILPFFKDTLQD